MKRLALSALLSTCIAGQAAALSCMAPSVPASFEIASEAEAQYVLAVGRVQILPGQPEPDLGDDPNDRQGYSVEARFAGRLGGPDGFEEEAVFPVTIEVECAGPWCGGIPLNRTLAFIERRDTGNVLVATPCDTFALTATPEVVAAAESCLAGGPCETPGG